jgi:hypothetical protein
LNHIKPSALLAEPYEVSPIQCDLKKNITPPASPYLKGRRKTATPGYLRQDWPIGSSLKRGQRLRINIFCGPFDRLRDRPSTESEDLF